MAAVRTNCSCGQRWQRLGACFEFYWTMLPTLADKHAVIGQLELMFSANMDAYAFAGTAPVILRLLQTTVTSCMTSDHSTEEHYPNICRAIVVSMSIEMTVGLNELKYTSALLVLCCRSRPTDVHFESFQMVVRMLQQVDKPQQLLGHLMKFYSRYYKKTF